MDGHGSVRPDAENDYLLPVTMQVERDHAVVLTGFGAHPPTVARQLHDEVVRRIRYRFEHGVNDRAELYGVAARIRERADERGPVDRATIFAPPADDPGSAEGVEKSGAHEVEVPGAAGGDVMGSQASSNEVGFRWTAEEELVREITDELGPAATALDFDSEASPMIVSEAGPISVVIGTVALAVLIEALRRLFQRSKHGLVVDARESTLDIRTDRSLPRDTLAVISHDGATVIHGTDETWTAELTDALVADSG